MWTGSHVKERVFSETTGSPSTSRHPPPRRDGEFRRPPQGRSEAWSGCGPRGGPADRPLPSAPNRAHAALYPGAREQSPRPCHARPTPRLGDPRAAPPLPRAPQSLFGWPGTRRLPSVSPRGRAPGTCLGSRGPRTAAARSPRSPQPAPPAPGPRSRPMGAGPHRRPLPHALAPRAALRLAATACSSCGHPRPGPEAPVAAPARSPGLPCCPGTRRLRRARGRFWGRECKQIGVL